jgi:hypothetical protein
MKFYIEVLRKFMFFLATHLPDLPEFNLMDNMATLIVYIPLLVRAHSFLFDRDYLQTLPK